MQLRQLVMLYKGFSDPTRLRILNLLTSQAHLKVGQIASILNIPQSTVSRQLAQLRASSLIQDERDGTWVKYSIVETPIVREGKLLQTVKVASTLCPELTNDISRMHDLLDAEEHKA